LAESSGMPKSQLYNLSLFLAANFCKSSARRWIDPWAIRVHETSYSPILIIILSSASRNISRIPLQIHAVLERFECFNNHWIVNYLEVFSSIFSNDDVTLLKYDLTSPKSFPFVVVASINCFRSLFCCSSVKRIFSSDSSIIGYFLIVEQIKIVNCVLRLISRRSKIIY
jgi:hypothetical protein